MELIQPVSATMLLPLVVRSALPSSAKILVAPVWLARRAKLSFTKSGFTFCDLCFAQVPAFRFASLSTSRFMNRKIHGSKCGLKIRKKPTRHLAQSV
jgi:hypothetical protein